jgi:uncharacterized membrane protein YfcA
MEGFWDQFAKSNIISGVMALGLTGAVIYLAVTGQPIPDLLGAALTSIIGFFFGTKVGEREGAAKVQRSVGR